MKVSALAKVGACLGALLWSLTGAWATTVRPPEFNRLVARAQCIVRAETIGTRSEWRSRGADRWIVTIVTVKVLDRVVGPAPAMIDLEFLGGTVGDDTMTVDGQPLLRKGDRDILFIENNGRQVCPLASMGYGRYPVIADPTNASRELVLREDGEPLTSVDAVASPLGSNLKKPSAMAMGASSPLTVAAFETQIRQAAVAAGRNDVTP